MLRVLQGSVIARAPLGRQIGDSFLPMVHEGAAEGLESGGPIRAALHIAAHPLTLLALQALLVAVLFEGRGWLGSIRHPDTASYAWSLPVERTLEERLAHYRTVGYPFFLRALGAVGLGWEAIPEAQLAVYLGAVLLLWSGATACWGRPWLALAAATPLLYLDFLSLVPFVQPDFLSGGLAIAATGLLLHLVARPGSVLLWASLAVAVFATYQVRPAAVFLVAWVPLAGAALGWLRRDLSPRRLALRAAGLAAATVLPWLAFATLRLVLVGHFGLVAFGGYNLSALASCFVDEALIRELPAPHARLARQIYGKRLARGWGPLELGGDTLPCFEQYNENLWRINAGTVWDGLRAQRRRQRAGRGDAGDLPALPERVFVNERLDGFARAVIAARPRLYLQWVVDAGRYGLSQLPEEAWIRWPALLLPPAAAAAWLAGRRRGAARGSPAGKPPAWRPLAGLWLLGGGYFVAYLVLTCLVSYPFQRYFLSIALLLPCPLAASLFEAVRLTVTRAHRGA